jgi:tetratricopeptide (TPR) repeat protein
MAVQDHLHSLLAWGAGETLPRRESYQALRSTFETFDATGVFEAVASMSRLLAMDPSFVRARIQIGSVVSRDAVEILRGPIMELYAPAHDADLTARQRRLVAMIDQRMAGRYQESFRLARDELARDPTDSWQRYQLLKAAHFANRPAAAIEAFEGLEWDPLVPNLFRFGAAEWTAAAYHRLGRHEDELELARAATARGPQHTTGSSMLRAELRALAALGRTDEIDRKISERLTEVTFFHPYVELHMLAGELRTHGFPDAARRIGTWALGVFRTPPGDGETDTCRHCDAEARANLLVDSGRPEQAYSQVLEAIDAGIPAHPGDSWDRSLAYFGAIAGDAPGARHALDRWLAGDPEDADGSAAYQTAMVLALLGDRDEAIEQLRTAVLHGFFAWDELHCEIAFEGLRDDPEFQDIVRPKG